jgi:hypothetical protein
VIEQVYSNKYHVVLKYIYIIYSQYYAMMYNKEGGMLHIRPNKLCEANFIQASYRYTLQFSTMNAWMNGCMDDKHNDQMTSPPPPTCVSHTHFPVVFCENFLEPGFLG